MSYDLIITRNEGPEKVIHGIKTVRTYFGYGLREAKDYVEAARNPEGSRIIGVRVGEEIIKEFQDEMAGHGFFVEKVWVENSEPEPMFIEPVNYVPNGCYNILLVRNSKTEKFIHGIKLLRQTFGWGLKEAKDKMELARTPNGSLIETTYWNEQRRDNFRWEMAKFGYAGKLVAVENTESDFKERVKPPEEKDESKLSLREVMIYRMEWRHYNQAEYEINCGRKKIQDVLDNPFQKAELNSLSSLELLDRYTGDARQSAVPFC